MEQHIVMENDMVIAGEVVIGADEEVNELHLQLHEKDQEIANLRAKNEQLTVEKNTEKNWKNYWFGAFNREKNRADGLQLEKDQAGFGLAVPMTAATTPAPPPLARYGPVSSNAPSPRPVNSFAEALEYWNHWNGRDERIDGIDLKEYLFHPDSRHQVPQIVRRVPSNIRQLFFIKNRGRDSFRSLTDQYRNHMNRTDLLRELLFIKNSQEDQAARGMINIRD
ncbi:Protein CBG21405 [Caenorhabditis briggsae]|uniref:Protein CBG21405 n=1 Tax=Caenorhabditis briggsae TaxID=6238 RepID=A8Y001_CAEBR|nr:Protein CBG21405 [Caenorhabditis briggsae]CAP38218.1 Protein CBG21405 [Caenorhabditis briggsae]